MIMSYFCRHNIQNENVCCVYVFLKIRDLLPNEKNVLKLKTKKNFDGTLKEVHKNDEK